MNLIAITIILLVLLWGTHILLRRFIIEAYNPNEDGIAHFGGIPNSSQVWAGLIKYPRQYV